MDSDEDMHDAGSIDDDFYSGETAMDSDDDADAAYEFVDHDSDDDSEDFMAFRNQVVCFVSNCMFCMYVLLFLVV